MTLVNGNISGHIDTQTARVIAERSDTKYNQVLRPPARLRRPASPKDFISLGFDTEFDPNGRLLSIQYAVVRNDGRLESTVIYRNELNKELLLKDIAIFVGGNLPKLVVLVSHFAQAEVSHITGALRDFAVHSYNKALEASTEYEFPEPENYVQCVADVALANNTSVRLRIVDLFGFVPSSLDKIGKSLTQSLGQDSTKLSVEGVGGKPETYWKTHMDELLRDHPREFDQYARRDAEVTLLAWARLRDFALKNYGLDVLDFRTTAGLALGVFRTKYLPSWKEEVAPTFKFAEPYNKKEKKTGKWVRAYRNVLYLRNDWRPVRDFAYRAYWGGHAESYGRGLFEGPFSYYDVDSLYPSSAALQPLPNAETEWITFDNLEDLDGLEGFADVTFSFPAQTFYPNLPVPGFKTSKLYFPLAGSTSVTIAEAREALRLGVKITKISGIGFKPRSTEVNHPVREFAIEFLRLKRESPKGSYERDLYKLILNALIGKFAETKKDAEVRRILSLLQGGVITFEDAPGIYREYQRGQYAGHKTPTDVGSGWWIEAASLVLGRARALMSEFVSKGALFTATDSVLLPSGTSIEAPALTALRSVGSDLKLEASPDKAWLMRTKVYALWEGDRVVKLARHGIPMEDAEFIRWVEDSVAKGEALPLTPTKTHLFTFKETITKGKPFGSSTLRETHPSLEWDNKREPRGITVELFRGMGRLYPPYGEMPEKMQTSGRPRSHEIDRIVGSDNISREAAKKRLQRAKKRVARRMSR